MFNRIFYEVFIFPPFLVTYGINLLRMPINFRCSLSSRFLSEFTKI